MCDVLLVYEIFVMTSKYALYRVDAMQTIVGTPAYNLTSCVKRVPWLKPKVSTLEGIQQKVLWW